jgi:hypothetical protein
MKSSSVVSWFLLPAAVHAFASVKKRLPAGLRPSSRVSKCLFSTTERVDGEVEDLIKSQKPVKTLAALERVLKRQKADIEMTENLLENLRNDGNSSGPKGEKSLAFAASIVSGFDYGFASRSEGAGVLEIEGGLPGYGPPKNLWILGWGQFWRNVEAMKGEYKDEKDNGK